MLNQLKKTSIIHKGNINNKKDYCFMCWAIHLDKYNISNFCIKWNITKLYNNINWKNKYIKNKK